VAAPPVGGGMDRYPVLNVVPHAGWLLNKGRSKGIGIAALKNSILVLCETWHPFVSKIWETVLMRKC